GRTLKRSRSKQRPVLPRRADEGEPRQARDSLEPERARTRERERPGVGPRAQLEGGAPRANQEMILVIDNYDSFTYNLVQYLGELGADIKVMRNDAVTLEEVA